MVEEYLLSESCFITLNQWNTIMLEEFTLIHLKNEIKLFIFVSALISETKIYTDNEVFQEHKTLICSI